MKKLLTLAVTASLVFAFAFTTYAETKLTVTGQLRSRGEGLQRSFDADDDHLPTMAYLRTRINFNAEVAENASAFVQLQDSRMYGEGSQSSTLANDANVGVHQAFIKYNLWTKETWSIGLQAGRFELNWGNQRLLGAVGWHNVGRSWEGEMAWYDAKKFSVTGGALKMAERMHPGYDRDLDAYLFAVKLKDLNLDLLIFQEDDKDTTGSTVADLQEMKRTTLAAFYKRKMEQIDMEFNFAMQTGTQKVSSTTELDISAMMFAGEVGFSFEGERNARVAIGIDYTSGDDYSDTTEVKTFNNLYWTGHKFNVYMDYFLGGGPNGLMDIVLRGKMDVTTGWTVGADLHLFSSAEDYSYGTLDDLGAPITVTSTDIGTEFDLYVKTSRVQGVALQWGFSVFTAKDDFADEADKQSGSWAYGQATMNF